MNEAENKANSNAPNGHISSHTHQNPLNPNPKPHFHSIKPNPPSILPTMGCFLASCFRHSKRRKPKKSPSSSTHVIVTPLLISSSFCGFPFLFLFPNGRCNLKSLVVFLCRFLNLMKLFIRWIAPRKSRNCRRLA